MGLHFLASAEMTLGKMKLSFKVDPKPTCQKLSEEKY